MSIVSRISAAIRTALEHMSDASEAWARMEITATARFWGVDLDLDTEEAKLKHKGKVGGKADRNRRPR